MSDLFGLAPRMVRYDAEQVLQAYLSAKRAGQSSTPIKFTDGTTRHFNVIWDGETFTRDSFDLEPLTAKVNHTQAGPLR